ncbi:hypothetical protein HDK77DRAFT_478256 [Phyllosticta capitalensis]
MPDGPDNPGRKKAHKELKKKPVIRFKKATLTCRGQCPFERLSTELVELIAANLDKKSMTAFRTTNKRIKNQVQYIFRKSFQSIQCRVSRKGREIERLEAIRGSEYADGVQSLTWIDGSRRGFPQCPDDDVGDFLQSEPIKLRDQFLQGYLRSPWMFISNLRTLKLVSAYNFLWDNGRHRREFAPAFIKFIDTINSTLYQLLSVSFFEELNDPEFDIVVEICPILSCILTPAENEPKYDIIVQSTQHNYPSILGQERLARDGLTWCTYALKMFLCVFTRSDLLCHPPGTLRICDFMIHYTDLDQFCGHSFIERMRAPSETLVLDTCTLVLDGRDSQMSAVELKALANSLKSTRFRELAFLDMSAKLASGASWVSFFEGLMEVVKEPPEVRPHLQSLRFERVQGVFFDWDGNGKLDNGERLPLIIHEIGLVAALERMIQCYVYSQPSQDGEKQDETQPQV